MEKKMTFDRFYYKVLGEYLTELRENQNRTFEEVAKIIDIPANTFYKYEKGLLKMPIKLFARLCSLYGVNMNDTLKLVHEKAFEEMMKEYKQ